MSGSGSSFATAATTAATLALDAAAPDQSVSLGNFLFDAWEIPEKITWGGTQRLNVHKLIGGVRVIDSMGPDPMDISWSGIFLSQDASLRADQVDRMRQSGNLQELIFAGRSYAVVISSFTADQRMLSYVPYQITCAVQRDLSIIVPNYLSAALEAVFADIVAVNSLLGTPPALLATAALTMLGVPPLLSALPVLVAGTAGTAAVVSGIKAGQSQITAADQTAEAQIMSQSQASATTGTLAGSTTVVGAVSNMNAALIATQTAAVAVAAGAYAGRALVNAGAA